MNQKEILQKIAEIQRDLEKEQFNIIKEKILERKFHLHKSKRILFIRKLIEKFRKRLILEIGLILDPILENQKEINLRFLKEIKRLKETTSNDKFNQSKTENDSKHQKPLNENPK
jgi:hypothetical protein